MSPVRPAEQHVNLEEAVESLVGAFSEREFRERTRLLLRQLPACEAQKAPARTESISVDRLPQGAILRTIKAVLASHPEGLRAQKVQRRVEAQLGRPVPKSTVYERVSENSSFLRVGRGWYRLRP